MKSLADAGYVERKRDSFVLDDRKVFTEAYRAGRHMQLSDLAVAVHVPVAPHSHDMTSLVRFGGPVAPYCGPVRIPFEGLGVDFVLVIQRESQKVCATNRP